MSDRSYDILVEPGKDNKVVKGWTRKVPIDMATINQLAQMSKMPFIFPYIAVMPDAHAGKGSCVGSVIPTKDAVMPAAVGVDIGCGMIAQKLNLKREAFDELEQEVWTTIMRTVPTGRTDHGGDRDIGGWQGFPHNRGNVPGRVFDRWESELAPEYS